MAAGLGSSRHSSRAESLSTSSRSSLAARFRRVSITGASEGFMRNGGSSIGPCNSTEDHLRVRAGLLAYAGALGAGATLPQAQTKILTVPPPPTFQTRTPHSPPPAPPPPTNPHHTTPPP